MKLLDEHKAIEFIQTRIDSRQWWVLPVCSPTTQYMAEKIEEAFYSGDANADYELLMIPCPKPLPRIIGLVFASKSRMTLEQMYRLFDIPTEGNSTERDFIATPDTPVSVVTWMDETFRWTSPPEWN